METVHKAITVLLYHITHVLSGPSINTPSDEKPYKPEPTGREGVSL